MAKKVRRSVVLGEVLYTFTSLQDWSNNVQQHSEQCSVPTVHRICLDALGRICTTANDLQRASIDGAYPVTVYCTDPRMCHTHKPVDPLRAHNYRIDWNQDGRHWEIVQRDGTRYPAGDTLSVANAVVMRLNVAHRPNIEMQDNKLCICWNLHDKGADCRYDIEIEFPYGGRNVL